MFSRREVDNQLCKNWKWKYFIWVWNIFINTVRYFIYIKAMLITNFILCIQKSLFKLIDKYVHNKNLEYIINKSIYKCLWNHTMSVFLYNAYLYYINHTFILGSWYFNILFKREKWVKCVVITSEYTTGNECHHFSQNFHFHIVVLCVK